MINPWNEIPLEDYENHMNLAYVFQLQTLNDIMKHQLNDYNISSVMILGIAGGNGLNNIDLNKIKQIYAIDINKKYLIECKNRYKNLGDCLITINADLCDLNTRLPYADLLIANLLIEYVGYEMFSKHITTIKPQFVSVVIQINDKNTFVSNSPYQKCFDNISNVYHEINKDDLEIVMNKTGYKKIIQKMFKLPNGKSLIRIDYVQLS